MSDATYIAQLYIKLTAGSQEEAEDIVREVAVLAQKHARVTVAGRQGVHLYDR